MGAPPASKRAGGGCKAGPADETLHWLIVALVDTEGGATNFADPSSRDDEEEDESTCEFDAGCKPASEALSPTLSPCDEGGWGFIRFAPASSCRGDGVLSSHAFRTMPFDASKGHCVVRWPGGV